MNSTSVIPGVEKCFQGLFNMLDTKFSKTFVGVDEMANVTVECGSVMVALSVQYNLAGTHHTRHEYTKEYEYINTRVMS